MNKPKTLWPVLVSLGATAALGMSVLTASPASAGDGLRLDVLVEGSPYTLVPEPFRSATDPATENLGMAQDDAGDAMVSYSGLTAQGNTVELIPTCTNPADPDSGTVHPMTQVELFGGIGYQHQDGGAATAVCTFSDIASFQLRIVIDPGSCLYDATQLPSGTYWLTATQPANQWINDYTVDTIVGYPAYVATLNGTPGDFTVADVQNDGSGQWKISAYLPAVRPCAPPTAPAVTGTATASGRMNSITLPLAQNFSSLPIASGGAGRYQQQQILGYGAGIVGAKRIQALPVNAGTSGTTPWGGYRSDGNYVMCGATSGVNLTQAVRCRLTGSGLSGQNGTTVPNYGVRVQVGGVKSPTSGAGAFMRWSAADTIEVGQTMQFRAREVTWAGYGLLGPVTTITMTNGA